MEPTNSYQLKQSDDDYILNVSLIKNGIKISCENSEGIVYSLAYTIDEIKNQFDIFSNAQSNLDIIESLDEIIRTQKVRVEKNVDFLSIEIHLSEEGKEIRITLEREGGAEDNAVDVTYTANPELNQVEENVEVNNYEQNYEGNEAYAEANLNVENYNNEYTQNDYQQTVTTETTNELEGFNTNQYLENNNEINAIPSEYNANYENAEAIVDNNYIPGTTNEDNNIYTNNETTVDIPSVQESATYQQSYDNLLNIQTQSAQGGMDYSSPYISPVEDEQPQIETQIQTENYETQIPTENYEAQIQAENYETQIPTENYEAQIQAENYDTQIQAENFEAQIQTQNYDTQIQEQNYEAQIPAENYETQIQTQNYDIQPEINNFETQAQAYNVNVDYSNTAAFNQINQTTTAIETNTVQTTTQNIQMAQPTSVKKYHKVSLSLPIDKKGEDDEKRLKKIKDEQSSLKFQYTQFNNKFLELSSLINTYKAQIAILEAEKRASELDDIRAENEKIKKAIAELTHKRREMNEIKELQNQLYGFNELKEKAAQVDAIKKQLAELNNLRAKIAELGGYKDKIKEINKLKEEIDSLNNTKSKIKSEEKITKMTRTVIKGDIIHNIKELEMITRKINRSNNKITLNLLYKATADSDSAKAFHQKCDAAESSLVLIETDKGLRFGGFTSTNWRGDCEEKVDPHAFIFSFDNMEIYDVINGDKAIGCYPEFGPVFMGCQIKINDNAFKQGGTTFEKGMNYQTDEDFVLNGGERAFNVKEIEVYEVIVE